MSRRPRASGHFRTGYAQDLVLIQSRTERVALVALLAVLALFPLLASPFLLDLANQVGPHHHAEIAVAGSEPPPVRDEDRPHPARPGVEQAGADPTVTGGQLARAQRNDHLGRGIEAHHLDGQSRVAQVAAILREEQRTGHEQRHVADLARGLAACRVGRRERG